MRSSFGSSSSSSTRCAISCHQKCLLARLKPSLTSIGIRQGDLRPPRPRGVPPFPLHIGGGGELGDDYARLGPAGFRLKLQRRRCVPKQPGIRSRYLHTTLKVYPEPPTNTMDGSTGSWLMARRQGCLVVSVCLALRKCVSKRPPCREHRSHPVSPAVPGPFCCFRASTARVTCRSL